MLEMLQYLRINLCVGGGGVLVLYMYYQVLKTLFNIVEERLKKLLNFDVSAV